MQSRPVVVLAALALGLAAGALLHGSASPARAGPQDRDPVKNAEDMTEAILDLFIEQVVLPPRVSWDDALLAQRTILICGEINRNTVNEAISKLLYLERLSAEPIDLWLRSTGGWENDAYAIADLLRAMKAPVNTWALGGCSSAGAVILASGTGRRRVLPHTRVSVHFNEEEGGGPHSDEKIGRERDDAFWRARARLPEHFYPVTQDREFSLSAEDAVKFGVADEIFDSRPGLAPKAPEAK